MKKLSIIVCTYNRSDFIGDCLNSIIEQVGSKGDIEVLVVDNASTDSTEDIVKSFGDNGVSYFYEENQGLSYARNRGYSEASGEWVAYVDDDAILRPGWLDSVLFSISYYGFDIFGGPYYSWYRDGKKSWFPDIYGSNTKWLNYSVPQTIEKEVSGGNAVYKKELLDKSPGFPVDVGMAGSKMAYGEETYLIRWMRKELNVKVGFVPSMAIDHYVPLHKQELSWYVKRAYSEGRDFSIRNGGAKSRSIYMLKCLLQFLATPLVLFKLYFANGLSLSVKAMILEFQRPVLKMGGVLAGIFS